MPKLFLKICVKISWIYTKHCYFSWASSLQGCCQYLNYFFLQLRIFLHQDSISLLFLQKCSLLPTDQSKCLGSFMNSFSSFMSNWTGNLFFFFFFKFNSLLVNMGTYEMVNFMVVNAGFESFSMTLSFLNWTRSLIISNFECSPSRLVPSSRLEATWASLEGCTYWLQATKPCLSTWRHFLQCFGDGLLWHLSSGCVVFLPLVHLFFINMSNY